jgi:transglutaminase-like putative cysteine protease
MPGVISTEKIDAEGNLLLQEVPMPGLGNMITRRTTKQKATGAADGPAPEILVKTFITPDKPIPNPEKAVKSRLRLTLMDGTINPLPSMGAQRVEMSEDGKSAILTIDINNPQSASAADEANPEYLAASAMIDTNDELIQKLAKRATASVKGDSDDAVGTMQRAEALRQFVRKHISKKGMATAFASASETAKMKTGDCSEHGVLLCALLRADGIPARVATGLVYVDQFEGNAGIFGWHMWTQALIDDKWVDLDATMRERFNATHVLTSASSLDDGAFNADMAAIVQMIGNLKIEVLDVQYE